MATVYARAAGMTRKQNAFVENQDRMVMVAKVMQKATYVLARKTPGERGEEIVGPPVVRYEVIQRYPWHLLCRHESGLMESFTFADILTGWVKAR